LAFRNLTVVGRHRGKIKGKKGYRIYLHDVFNLRQAGGGSRKRKVGTQRGWERAKRTQPFFG